jgi:CHAT domain-containing protein/tetratricopeptide (TPR) repeat protein
LQRNRIQDAVFAFESGLLALARDPRLKLDELSVGLGAVSKGLPARELPVPSDLYSEAAERDLAAAERDEGLTARLLIGVGNSYLRQFQDAPALNAYGLALQRPELERLPRLKAFVLANRGEALRRQGRLGDAEQALLEAVARLEREAPAVEQRRALALLAGIYRDRRQDDQSQSFYDRALALYAQANDGRGEAAVRTGLGHLWMRQGRCDDAVPQYTRAIELAKALDDRNVLWPAWLGLGRCERARGRLDEAAAALANSYELVRDREGDLRTDEGKVGLLESAQDLQDELLKLELQRAPRNPAAYARLLELTERARGSALQALMQGWGNARPSAASFGLPECVDESSARNPVAPRDLQRQQAPSVPSPAQMAPAVGLPDFSALPNAPAFPNAAAFPLDGRARTTSRTQRNPPPLARLVFYVFDDRTLVLLVGADGAVHGHAAALGRQALAQRVEQLRTALDVQGSARGVRGMAVTRSVNTAAVDSGARAGSDYRRASRALFDLLIAPIAQHLPAAGQTLAVEPHDALWLLPFAALDAGGAWMGERWPLVYAPSAELLREARSRAAPERGEAFSGLIVGNPVVGTIDAGNDAMFRLGFAPLPGADEEARKIEALFPGHRGKLLRGRDGALATVVREAPSHDVLHFASHGVARSDDPLASFVLLAPSPCGELLTARRVMTLSLKADLVVLSACQTGLGRIAGEGVLGLSRAFLFAGATSVLVSHWSISDHATTALMAGFYARYLGQGMDKAKALQESMGQLRRQRGFEHPRYWAPFFLVGAE